MNYRHLYHAGNFADVLKHIVIARILTYQMSKPAPLRYIDTHAGLGWYDLASAESTKTGEWRSGIGRLVGRDLPEPLSTLLRPYLDAVGPRDGEGRPALYPGSAGLAQRLLRTTDRLSAFERHPEDAAVLRRTMGRDRRVKIHASDGYAGLNAALPPPERRGLVLIDPPFENKDEADHLREAVAAALRKWATGTFAIWYPIKEAGTTAVLVRGLAAAAPGMSLRTELVRDADPAKPNALRGCGLVVINPPFVLDAELRVILPFLKDRFDDDPSRPWSTLIEASSGC